MIRCCDCGRVDKYFVDDFNNDFVCSCGCTVFVVLETFKAIND